MRPIVLVDEDSCTDDVRNFGGMVKFIQNIEEWKRLAAELQTETLTIDLFVLHAIINPKGTDPSKVMESCKIKDITDVILINNKSFFGHTQ